MTKHWWRYIIVVLPVVVGLFNLLLNGRFIFGYMGLGTALYFFALAFASGALYIMLFRKQERD